MQRRATGPPSADGQERSGGHICHAKPPSNASVMITAEAMTFRHAQEPKRLPLPKLLELAMATNLTQPIWEHKTDGKNFSQTKGMETQKIAETKTIVFEERVAPATKMSIAY